MRMSELFGRTLREPPAEAEGAGYKMLQRAAYLRAPGGSSYVYLPLGQGALAQLAAALAPSTGGRDAAELELPQVDGPGDLARFASSLGASEIQSYRQLPVAGLARGTWRHEHGQGRGGPLNACEGPGLFVVTIDATEEAAGLAYAEQQRTFLDLCRRCGLAVLAATSPTAPAASHAYLYLSEDGMERVLLCDGCGYAALEQEASSGHPNVEAEAVLPLERVATPHASTIADLAQYLCVPESRTAKAVFRTASVDEGERFVFAVVRGDTDVSEEKLRATLRTLGVRASALRAATDAEIRATGATPGYASPVGLKNVLVVVDELAARSPNLVAGANEEGYHLLNTNNGRDYQASVVADIALAKAGDSCPACGHALRGATAALLARSERVPTEKGGPAYLDATGRSQPVWIGIHLVDLGALLAAVASERCDEQGLALPPAAAPFAVHLVGMPGADAEVEALYRSLWDSGLPCLWDDRGDSAGVKFTDADLIGLPVRITLGKRSLQAGGAEFKRREPGAAGGEKWIVPLDAAIETARRVLTEVEANAIAGIKELRYGEHLR